jgi:hypothetical protein
VSKFVHPLQADRRCPERFSFGAASFTALWAYAEGMKILGGRLYVIDSVLIFASTLVYVLLTRFVPDNIGLGIGVFTFLLGRVAIGFLAPRYLREHLETLGYRQAPSIVR